MPLPRTADIALSFVPSSSRPRYFTEPVTVADLSSRPMTAIDVTDLPEPDSPTMPRVSPGRTA